MTPEEKAKAYDEALKEAFIAYKDEDKHLKATLERIFPELTKSEDGRMFKAITKGIRDLVDDFGWSDFGNVPIDDIFAWLEQQGEQKPTEWSEEDERMVDSFLHKLEVCDLLSNKEIIWIKNKFKSLRDKE